MPTVRSRKMEQGSGRAHSAMMKALGAFRGPSSDYKDRPSQ